VELRGSGSRRHAARIPGSDGRRAMRPPRRSARRSPASTVDEIRINASSLAEDRAARCRSRGRSRAGGSSPSASRDGAGSRTRGTRQSPDHRSAASLARVGPTGETGSRSRKASTRTRLAAVVTQARTPRRPARRRRSSSSPAPRANSDRRSPDEERRLVKSVPSIRPSRDSSWSTSRRIAAPRPSIGEVRIVDSRASRRSHRRTQTS